MNNKIFILDERGLLYISGEDADDFLQNIISNDITKVSSENSIFASMLSPQGKYLFDFLIVKHKKGYFIDCDKNQIEKIYKQLDLYKIRSKVEITNLSNEFVVAVITKEKFLKLPSSKNEEGFTLKFREDPITLDPRNKDLGARLIINLEKLYLTIKKLGMNIVNNEEYYDLSHKLGIPQLNNVEMQNKVFGIECNFDELNAIDFKKGCYIGQENTSRIKLRNKLSKRLFPIKIIEGKLNLEDSILSNEKIIGKILINDKYPFGVVKFKECKIDYSNNYKTKNALIRFIKPFWEN